MLWPKPKVPKGFFGWKLKNRQRFARWYWNPMWKIKSFCRDWVSVRGIIRAYVVLRWKICQWWWEKQYYKRQKRREKNG
jgi:hypothetical protein